jgi:hypothetical protein
MKRTLLLVVAAALGTGCGPFWEGTYSGTYTFSDSCSDGAFSNYVGTTVWTVTQSGGSLAITQQEADCGTFTANVDGTTAFLQGKACPSYVYDNVIYYPQLTDGTVLLRGDHVTASENYVIAFNGAYPGSCNRIADIDLIRN